VLASLEMCWHSLKEQVKSVGKLRNVLAFAEGAVKRVLPSLEKCWHSQKERVKSVGKLRKVLAFAKGAVKKISQA